MFFLRVHYLNSDILELFACEKENNISADELFFILDSYFRGLSKVMITEKPNTAKQFK